MFENIISLTITFSKIDPPTSEIFEHNEQNKITEKYNSGRLEFKNTITNNDSILMEYNGVNHFLSTNNNRMMRFITKTIFKKEYELENLYKYEEGQYVIDSIIGLKYIVSNDRIDNYLLIEERKEKPLYVYENQNYIGLGYIIKNECNGIEYGYKVDQEIYNCICGTHTNYYKEYKLEKTDTKLYINEQVPGGDGGLALGQLFLTL